MCSLASSWFSRFYPSWDFKFVQSWSPTFAVIFEKLLYSLPLWFSGKFGLESWEPDPFEHLSSWQVKSVDGQWEPRQANCQLLCQGHSYLRTILQFILPISEDSYLDIYSSNSTLFQLHSQSLCNSYYTFWKTCDATWKMSIFHSIRLNFSLKYGNAILNRTGIWGSNFNLVPKTFSNECLYLWNVKWCLRISSEKTLNLQFLHCCFLHLATHLKKLISISKQQSEF